MIVKNLTKNIVLSEHAQLADTFFSRMRGLLGRRMLSEGESLVITQCNSIHMFFMKFAIDAMFLDSSDRVAGVVKNIQPFQMSPVFWAARRVVELPAGTLDRTDTCLGDTIQIK